MPQGRNRSCRGPGPAGAREVAVRAAAVLLALAPAPAAAAMQAAPPAVGTRPEDLAMMHEFSRCIVKASPGQAARILQLDYRKDSYRRSLRNFAQWPRHCAPMGGRLRMAGVLLAGSFAEALLPRALAGRSLAAGVARDPARAPIEARDDGEYLGLCAVRTMPEQVSALLATAPSSEDEKKAVAVVAPGLPSCVRAGGSAIVNRPALRALLALAAYRMVTRSAPSAGGEG
jgi:hypothetical protein